MLFHCTLTCDIKRNGEGTHHGALHRLGGERGAGEGGAVVLRRRRELQHGLGLPDGRDPLEGGRGAEVCNVSELVCCEIRHYIMHSCTFFCAPDEKIDIRFHISFSFLGRIPRASI